MRLVLRFSVLLVILALLGGCESIYIGSKPHSGDGPPPHASAHGHRHKHHRGAELKFDSALGVYVVVGLPNHFYYDELFFRLHGDSWQVSAQLDGPWESRSSSFVPPGLQSKHDKKHHGKSKGRGAGGHPPGKADW